MYDSLNNGRVRRRGENVMGKIASAIVAVTLLTSPLLLPVPASAENGQIAAGVVGGLIGGGVLRGALAAPAAPPPPPGYYFAGPGCVQKPSFPLGREAHVVGVGRRICSMQ